MYYSRTSIRTCKHACESMTHVIVSIINHTLPSTIRAVISTLTCMSMASDSTSDSEYVLFARMSTSKSIVATLIVQGLKCVIN